MINLTVPLGERAYPIYVGNRILPDLAALLPESTKNSGILIVTHPRLALLYGNKIIESLKANGLDVSITSVRTGERYKRLSTVEHLYDRMICAELDRKSAVIALGGGVVGDVVGFAAATYMRGIPFIQVPTTLLSQVDASVGGKTGVDLPGGKNMVGAFHQPSAVVIDIGTLNTLPVRELKAGLAEVLKHGIICDEDYFVSVSNEIKNLLHRDAATLEKVVARSCEIKAAVIATDEKEHGRRALLNFGHTVGHALEALTGYTRYKHGEAVAIGMVCACAVGRKMRVTNRVVQEAVKSALVRAGLPVSLPKDVNLDELILSMNRDKKREGGRHRFVLVDSIGHAFLQDDVPESAIRSALAGMIQS